MKKVIILIPCYNEEKTIKSVLINIKNLKSKNYEYYSLVIDDCSTDNSFKISSKYANYVYKLKNKVNLAKVVSFGLKKVIEKNPDIIVHIDADMQYDSKDIPKLLNLLAKKKSGLVIGVRKKNIGLVKKIGNFIFTTLTSLIIKKKLKDSQSGFRALNIELAKKIHITSKYTYTQEQIIRTNWLGYSIYEVPIKFKKRKHGKSRLISNIFVYGFNAFYDIIKLIIHSK
ncbi:glycosyltransferase family 2 protein [archaeon]|jgi:glycosyltransferase involved in cell wall biosynthesis|nr:glycosyltransferase family 2 protein [archaeon]MBT4022049.1 glycosyltransferase family 2 protein [archaeon]MBT4272662.1 glycosyltransferase family 2 protein [archaeon]MBT4461460.1 glycosyltransferase family 2 protein [archaeon]MBT4857770.1 glycosyltransferase family 2 protein [archaeon]